MPISEVFNMDCMEYMKSIPNKFFELALADNATGKANLSWDEKMIAEMARQI
jgi:hypothetical protein